MGDQIHPSPPTPLAAMGLRLLLLLLVFQLWGSQGSPLDPSGQHVCVGSRWVCAGQEQGGGFQGKEAGKSLVGGGWGG